MKYRKALIIISSGTSFGETYAKTILPCEKRLAESFPDFVMFRSFTSRRIIEKLKERNGMKVETPPQVLERLIREKFEEVLIQPLLIVSGENYSRQLLDAIEPFKKKFASLRIGPPLLHRQSDYESVLSVVEKMFPDLNHKEAVVFVAHGTDQIPNGQYAYLQAVADRKGLSIHIGCLKGVPDVDCVLNRLESASIQTAHLVPLMLTAGRHANIDLDGNSSHSWRYRLEAMGFKTIVHMRGLCESDEIREMFVQKALGIL